MNNVSNRIEFESRSLGKTIENAHKVLIAQSYQCMSSCFRSEKQLKDCNRCAERCHYPVQMAHDDIQGEINNLESRFIDCVNVCDSTHGYNFSNNLQTCINKCTDVTVKQYQVLTEFASRTMRSYSNR